MLYCISVYSYVGFEHVVSRFWRVKAGPEGPSPKGYHWAENPKPLDPKP